MHFSKSSLQDVTVIDLDRREDERGYFARTMCRKEFQEHGLEHEFVQAGHSFNRLKGTLRGMHLQRHPHGETKLVRCVRGAIYDVVIDLRPQSPTFRRWEGFELTAENGRMLYVPIGFAHGFLTLLDGSGVDYLLCHEYVPQARDGVRFDDPAFSILWPVPITVISEQDRAWPLQASLSEGVCVAPISRVIVR
jgi:dTDP-4-dehydrorhamnose 3,5-epimerase